MPKTLSKSRHKIKPMNGNQNTRQLSFGELNQGINFNEPKDTLDYAIKKDVANLMNRIKNTPMDGRLQSTAITQLEVSSMLAVKGYFAQK